MIPSARGQNVDDDGVMGERCERGARALAGSRQDSDERQANTRSRVLLDVNWRGRRGLAHLDLDRDVIARVERNPGDRRDPR
ncbi:MAG TPA: hypothetical protein VF215_14835, partial [Thermoanaerobaculia bacterium]